MLEDGPHRQWLNLEPGRSRAENTQNAWVITCEKMHYQSEPLCSLNQRIGGILLGNRNKGQFGARSETIAFDDCWAVRKISSDSWTRTLRHWRLTQKAAVVANLLDLAMLICASVSAMAFGILAAYAILRAGFALIRPQRRPAAVKAQPQTARVS